VGSQTLRFLEFELDLAVPELRKGGDPIRIRQKPLHLLAYLAANQKRVVSKNELLERVWHGVSVSADALTSALRDLRRALGDTDSPHRLIVTVRARGYRLEADVQSDTADRDPQAGAEPQPVEVFQQGPRGSMSRLRWGQQESLLVQTLVEQLARAALSHTGRGPGSGDRPEIGSVNPVEIVITVRCQPRSRFRSVRAEGARAVAARAGPRSRRRPVRG
jgi:DNA-binding winged helix-turn-helix (wHTH) protein